MERFSHRESVLLSYSPEKLLMNSSSSPKSPYGNSDIDFNDVFGGPPRRSSMPEITDSVAFKGDDETETSRSSSWSGLREKPVFGEEGVNRRHYPSQDFFDDIFRGNESLTSSPRKHDLRDAFSSAPGSRVLSPARPLPPKAEPFGSSLPAQFSLPAKLSKGMDLPIFGSSTRTQCKYKDGAPNGTSSYSYSPLSRLSSQANQGQEDSRNDVRPSYRQTPLFQELSLSSEESSNLTKSDETDKGGNAKRDSSCSDVSTNGSQFHFSIYKWACKGVPLVMPLRGGNSSRLKEIKTERCSSSNGRIESMTRELSTATSHDIDLPSSNNRISTSTESYRMECDKQVNDSLLDTSTQDSTEPCQIVEETILPTSDTETLSNLKSTVKNVTNTFLQDTRKQTKPHSLPESAFSEKTEKETSVTPKETQKPELKPLFSLFCDNDDDQDIDEITGKAKGKESTVKSTKKSSLLVDVGKSIKKQDGKRTSSDTRELDKARLQGSHAKSGDLGKNSVKGKVKEFVKLFNHEASSKPKLDIDSQRQSFRKERGTSRAESEVSVSTSGTKVKMHIPNVHAKKTMADAPIMVDDYFKQPEEKHSAMTNTNYLSNDTSSGQKDTSASSTASISNGSKAKVEDTEESFHGNFMIKELAQDGNKLPQTGDDPEDIQVIDTKIRQWSYGKEGNIRSLLSTLQYVLWPESGWKPVPLVDIIEGNAVKRSYQKALLCLHPDKLQQKGAALHQKYIAEKVFDILQDAWTHFNSLGSL